MENQNNSFFNSLFGKASRIIGFTADIIAITSINIGLKISDGENLPRFIGPDFAFTIWILSVYTYICLLNDFWKKHKDSKDYSSSFSLFLLEDLFLEFREPFLLLPGIIAAILLLQISLVADKVSGGESGWTVFLFIGIIVGLFELIPFLSNWKDRKVNPSLARKIDKSWPIIQQQVYLLLPKRRDMISKYDIEGVLRDNGLPIRESTFDYLFRRMSSENEDLDYGIIFNLKEETIVTHESVLVKMDSLQEDHICIPWNP